jgi:hypothetical protein
MGNSMGKEMLSKLPEIMRSKPNLVSLCGIADDATEADLSDLGMDADDAIILASELPNKRALSSLNLANNNLGELVLPEDWTAEGMFTNTHKHTDGREQKHNPGKGKPESIIAIANAIPDMRAISLLNLSRNELGVKGVLIMCEGLLNDARSDTQQPCIL